MHHAEAPKMGHQHEDEEQGENRERECLSQKWTDADGCKKSDVQLQQKDRAHARLPVFFLFPSPSEKSEQFPVPLFFTHEQEKSAQKQPDEVSAPLKKKGVGVPVDQLKGLDCRIVWNNRKKGDLSAPQHQGGELEQKTLSFIPKSLERKEQGAE